MNLCKKNQRKQKLKRKKNKNKKKKEDLLKIEVNVYGNDARY